MSGGGSLGYGQSDSSNNSGFNQGVWQPSGDAQERMYGQLGNLFDQSTGQSTGGGGGKGGSAGGAGGAGRAGGAGGAGGAITQSIQNQMQGGAYKDMGLQNSLMGSLDKSLNTPTATQGVYRDIMGGSGNTSLGSYQDSLMQQGQDIKNQNLGMLDARAAANGMGGSSPYGKAIANSFDKTDKNTQANIGSLGYNAFENDLNRKLGIADQADQGTLQRQQLMSGMIGQQQGAMQGGVGQGMAYQNQQAMQPWQQAGAYANALGGPTVLSSGQSSGNSSSKGGGGSAGGGSK